MSRPKGYKHTKETIRRMKENHGKWNKDLTKETNFSLKKQSKSLKEHWKEEGHPRGMLGKKHSEATKKKMSLAKQGTKNTNWKGGKTLSVRLFRKSKQYQQWRRAILKRDNGICQIENCGKKSNIIHHKLSVKDYPDLRLVLKNGIVVCKKHHKQIHKKK